MRLFPNLVQATVGGLQEIFNDKIQADRVVQHLLKSNSKWGSRDRRFLADTIYSVVRWYRLYYEILDHEPNSAASWWEILGIHWILQGETLPPFKEFKRLNPASILEKKEKLSAIRKIKASIPDWLDEIGKKELGKNWESVVHNCNAPQKVNLRVNTLRCSKSKCMASLKKEGVEAISNDADCLTLLKRSKLNHLSSFKKGFYEVQDQGSQLIAPFLNPASASLVIDACAGAGGKSLHLASLMKNKGQIISMDIHSNKLKELNKRASRAGVKIIQTEIIGADTIEKFRQKADYLLLDVPCSGLGTLKRKPDTKWKLTPEFVAEIKEVQRKILHSYSSMVKQGGQMVYATCSILPSENEEQVNAFLVTEVGKAFELVKQHAVLPGENHSDGFFMALLKKK